MTTAGITVGTVTETISDILARMDNQIEKLELKLEDCGSILDVRVSMLEVQVGELTAELEALKAGK